MSKSFKYGANGALIFGIGNTIINAFKQHQRINENPEVKFDWSELFEAGGKGAIVGGIGGAVIGGLMDLKNLSEEPLNTTAILNTVVASTRLDKNNPAYKQLSRKADFLITAIKSNFRNQLGGQILRIGSTEDNTALSTNFDIDISIPFKSGSFSSISVMFDELLRFIENEYRDTDLVKIRIQKKSIGLIYEIENEDYKIDVVPYKQTKGSRNKMAGYLIVNSDSIFGNDSYTKTDISCLKSLKLTPVQQKLAISFKNWKQKFSIPVSSHLLRLLILDAYSCNKGNIPRDYTMKILMIVHHIKNNIVNRRIVSTENTNNVLTDMNISDKKFIKKECEKIVTDYHYQPNTILSYFE